MPQLELYSWVAKDLQTWIDNNKKTYREAEEEVAKVTPILFREYSSADEEDRADLLVCQMVRSQNGFWADTPFAHISNN